MAKDKILLTQEFFIELKERLKTLQTEGRTKIAEEIQSATSYGDLSENAEYKAAKIAQEKLELEIMRLEEVLEKAQPIDKSLISLNKIGYGNKVTLKDLIYNDVEEYTIVDEVESNINSNKIAVDSPLGAALLGKKKGDIVEYTAPGGQMRVEILKISK